MKFTTRCATRLSLVIGLTYGFLPAQAANAQPAAGDSISKVSSVAQSTHKKAYKPEECDSLIEEAIKNKDLEAAVSLYEQNGTFITDSGKPVYGHDAVREQMRPLMRAESFGFTTQPKAFVSADGNIALLRGAWSAKIKDSQGNLKQISGNNVEVVRKQADGSWRFVIDHPTLAD